MRTRERERPDTDCSLLNQVKITDGKRAFHLLCARARVRCLGVEQRLVLTDGDVARLNESFSFSLVSCRGSA